MIVHTVKVGEQLSEHISSSEHKKIYVGCAEADIRYRDMLIYGRHRWELYSRPSLDFISLDCFGMGMNQYKAMVEKAIRGVDGVMIIVSAQTSNDPLALWLIDCTLSKSIPIVGVDVRPKSEGIIPLRLADNMIMFGWEWFAEFFNGL